MLPCLCWLLMGMLPILHPVTLASDLQSKSCHAMECLSVLSIMSAFHAGPCYTHRLQGFRLVCFHTAIGGQSTIRFSGALLLALQVPEAVLSNLTEWSRLTRLPVEHSDKLMSHTIEFKQLRCMRMWLAFIAWILPSE